MKLSFIEYLRTGQLPPLVFGSPRAEVLRFLGTPSSWVSQDDPLFEKPRRDHLHSDSVSYGSLAFSFDENDRVEQIMLAMAFECSWPAEAQSFPTREMRIPDIIDLMREHNIPFADIGLMNDGSMLRTASGVEILASQRLMDERRLLSCCSKWKQEPKQTPLRTP